MVKAEKPVLSPRRNSVPESDREIDDYAGYDDELNNADNDFLPDQGDPKLAALVKEMFDTRIGKLRKAVLTRKQSVALARAWAFAALQDVPALAALADMLADTTVSIGGKGLNQMVQVMSARMSADDDDAAKRLGRSLGL
jgi:hypothetical protein